MIEPSQTPHDLQNTLDDTDLFCRRCGVINETLITSGRGPHHAAAVCAACGAFIQWLAKPRPPTERQLKFLHALGYCGPKPETLQAASARIKAMLKAKEVRCG